MRKLLLLISYCLTKLIEALHLGEKLTLQKIHPLGEPGDESRIIQLLKLPITILIVKPGKTLPSAHRLHPHHNAIEIIIAFLKPLHDFQGIVKTSLKNGILSA